LVVCTKTPSMFGKSPVHAWRYCGGLKRKFYIGSLRVNSFWHPKRC
jgi:hypothetical protein